jgi:uncharacterized protein (DUF1330 family)
MFAVNPSPEALQGLTLQVPDGQPIVMINLLRFREWAEYPAGVEFEKRTGRQAYEIYSRHALPFLMGVGGRPIWRGQASFTVIALPGERWDEAILVQYPSRSAFERMITNPDYQSGLFHRTAALEDSRLIATTKPQKVGHLAWRLFKLFWKLRGPAALGLLERN